MDAILDKINTEIKNAAEKNENTTTVTLSNVSYEDVSRVLKKIPNNVQVRINKYDNNLYMYIYFNK